jgi:hypothetical protein
MECLLGAICLYVDLAIGYSQNEDVQDAFRAMPQVEWSTLPSENPMAGATLGIDRKVGGYTVFAELRHHSSLPDGVDRGTNGAWVGTRLRW